jgi:hypothetical protein
MAMDDTAPRRGPVALADLFDAALKDLAPKPPPHPPPAHAHPHAHAYTCAVTCNASSVRRCVPLQWQPA